MPKPLKSTCKTTVGKKVVIVTGLTCELISLTRSPDLFSATLPLSELQLTCPDLSSIQTSLLGKGKKKWIGREKTLMCAHATSWELKGAKVKLFDRTVGEANRNVEFLFDVVFFVS